MARHGKCLTFTRLEKKPGVFCFLRSEKRETSKTNTLPKRHRPKNRKPSARCPRATIPTTNDPRTEQLEKVWLNFEWPPTSLSSSHVGGMSGHISNLVSCPSSPHGGCRSCGWAGASGLCVLDAGSWGCGSFVSLCDGADPRTGFFFFSAGVPFDVHESAGLPVVCVYLLRQPSGPSTGTVFFPQVSPSTQVKPWTPKVALRFSGVYLVCLLFFVCLFFLKEREVLFFSLHLF